MLKRNRVIVFCEHGDYIDKCLKCYKKQKKVITKKKKRKAPVKIKIVIDKKMILPEIKQMTQLDSCLISKRRTLSFTPAKIEMLKKSGKVKVEGVDADISKFVTQAGVSFCLQK